MSTPKAQKFPSVIPTAAKARTGGRSARVVRDVVAAALSVFAERGYAGFSMDEVASRAGVNKTTVYRRWPTKADLVGAALFSLRDQDPELPDTGSVREDLIRILRDRVPKMVTPHRRAIMHALLMGQAEPELQKLIERMRRERPAIPALVLDRAIARGELPADVDRQVVLEALLGPLHTRAYWKREPISDRFIHSLVNLVIAGAAVSRAQPHAADFRARDADRPGGTSAHARNSGRRVPHR